MYFLIIQLGCKSALLSSIYPLRSSNCHLKTILTWKRSTGRGQEHKLELYFRSDGYICVSECQHLSQYQHHRNCGVRIASSSASFPYKLKARFIINHIHKDEKGKKIILAFLFSLSYSQRNM